MPACLTLQPGGARAGAALAAVLPSEVRHNLAEPELELFTKYSRNLAGYMRSVGADLTADLTPPKSLYIEV